MHWVLSAPACLHFNPCASILQGRFLHSIGRGGWWKKAQLFSQCGAMGRLLLIYPIIGALVTLPSASRKMLTRSVRKSQVTPWSCGIMLTWNPNKCQQFNGNYHLNFTKSSKVELSWGIWHTFNNFNHGPTLFLLRKNMYLSMLLWYALTGILYLWC